MVNISQTGTGCAKLIYSFIKFTAKHKFKLFPACSLILETDLFPIFRNN